MAESSMRERIARVLDPEAFRVRGDIAASSDLGKRIAGMRRHALSQADAVLEALREPDEGMVERGAIQHGLWVDGKVHAKPIKQNARAIFTAMIDHARNDGR